MFLTWHLFQKLIFSKRAGSLIKKVGALTVFSVFLSVSAFLVVLFVMNGMNNSMRNKIMSLEPHFVVTTTQEDLLSQFKSSDVFLTWVEDKELRAMEFERQDLIVKTTEGQFRGVLSVGVTSQSLEIFLSNIRLQAKDFDGGEVLNQMPDANEVIMGSDLARSLGVFEGDSVSFVSPESLLMPVGTVPRIEKLKVKHIFTTTLPDIDGRQVFYLKGGGLSRLNQIGGVERGFEFFLKDGYQVDKYKSMFPQIEGLKLETWMERNSALFFALKIEKINIGLVLSLAGIIAGSSILTILSLLISMKKRDIAVLRVLGLSESGTEKLFTRIGVMLALSGVIAGTIFGTLLSLYIEQNPLNVLPDIYYDSEIPAQVDFGLVALVLFVGAILAYLGARIPASHTKKLEPTVLLRR